MKPRTKKVIVLAALMGTCFTAGVFASNGVERVDAFLRPDFHVLVDGKEASLRKPPLIYDDNSYLPVKEISELLNVNVNWEDQTKSIYLNSRVPGQLSAENSADERYPDIVLVRPQSFTVTYLGATNPLLSLQTDKGIYYRASDLERMGLDIRGVKKAREIYTHALYVREDDIGGLWKKYPEIRNVGTGIPMVADESDPEKIKLLNDIAKNSLQYIGAFNTTPSYGYPSYPSFRSIRVFAIDPYPGKENEYLIYTIEEKGAFYVYHVPLAYDEQNKKWYSTSVNKMTIEAISQL